MCILSRCRLFLLSSHTHFPPPRQEWFLKDLKMFFFENEFFVFFFLLFSVLHYFNLTSSKSIFLESQSTCWVHFYLYIWEILTKNVFQSLDFHMVSLQSINTQAAWPVCIAVGLSLKSTSSLVCFLTVIIIEWIFRNDMDVFYNLAVFYKIKNLRARWNFVGYLCESKWSKIKKW